MMVISWSSVAAWGEIRCARVCCAAEEWPYGSLWRWTQNRNRTEIALALADRSDGPLGRAGQSTAPRERTRGRANVCPAGPRWVSRPGGGKWPSERVWATPFDPVASTQAPTNRPAMTPVPFFPVRIGVEEQVLADTIPARGVRAVIIGHNRYVGPLYGTLAQTGKTSGAILARFGVGHDGLDKAKAPAHGIVVTNTAGTLDASVAEHVFWLLGRLVKQVPRLDAGFRRGQFAGYAGVELCGKTLGLLGFGGIARAVTRIAHFGLGMRILACGRPPATAGTRRRPAVGRVARPLGLGRVHADPDRICRESDAMSIHLPAQLTRCNCRRPALAR